MGIPDPGPLGETSFEARLRAMVAALLLKRPFGGCVESVVTFAIHLFGFLAGIIHPLYIKDAEKAIYKDAEKAAGEEQTTGLSTYPAKPDMSRDDGPCLRYFRHASL